MIYSVAKQTLTAAGGAQTIPVTNSNCHKYHLSFRSVGETPLAGTTAVAATQKNGTEETVTDSAVRRLIVDAGEVVSDLILLCRADITSKNEAKVEKHLRNLILVEQKIAEVNAKDELRNWQPVLTGNHNKEYFHLSQPQHSRLIKDSVREAILDGVIENNLEDALAKATEIALTMGVKPRIV